MGRSPGGKAAVYLYVGPYEELPKAHLALKEWMKKQGHAAAGPPWEVYLNNPRLVSREKLRTRVCYPVK